MAQRRSRGRPRGTGKNDAAHLARVAEMLVANPQLRPTTAMKKIIAERVDWPETETTLVRRWQVKWKDEAPAHMKAARAKVALEPAVVSTGSVGGGYTSLAMVDQMYRDHQRTMRDLVDPPHMRALRESRAAIAGVGSWLDHHMREQQRMQDLIDPPHMRKMREQMQDVMRMQDKFREIENQLREIDRIQNMMRRGGLW